MKLNILRVVSMCLALAPAAVAQDECATAMPVTNGDVIAFDTTAATLSATPWNCAFNGGPDLWYSITSTTGGAITFATCGSGYDTALEAFSGSCAALTPLVCNDDACGLQSRITFSVTIGDTYRVRVGGYNGSTGSGTLTVAEAPPPTPVTIVDDVPGTFVDISTTGTPLGLTDDGAVDIATTVGNHVLAAGVARVGSNGGVRFDGTGFSLGYTNQNIPSLSAFSGDRTLLPFWDDINTASGTNGEIYHEEVGGVLIIQWEDAGFFSSTDTVTFQLQVFPGTGPRIAQYLYESVDSARADLGGSASIGFQSGDLGGLDDVEWSFNTSGSVMNGTVLTVVTGPGGLGTNYCAANPNSTGTTGAMSATGSASVASNDLALVASDLPMNAFGFFLVSNSQGFVTHPGSSAGNLCLGGAIGRYVGPGQVQQTDTSGQISLTIDNTVIPGPGGFHSASAGDVLNFQAWHRDAIGGVATSNFTDGLSVTFDG